MYVPTNDDPALGPPPNDGGSDSSSRRLRRSRPTEGPADDASAAAVEGSGWRLQHTGALDGVRAIAVLLVLGVHAWFSELPGGGIGVTIFFTLSGFLITVLLLGEVVDLGRLSFKNFYVRRILRLFPALVVFVAVVWAYCQITGIDQAKMGSAVPAALLYYANWTRVAGVSMGPLGHTWSLAVEEQFYLLWPLLLWLGHRVARLWGVLAMALLGVVASTAVRIAIQANPTPESSVRVQNGFDTQSAAIFVGCAVATLLVLGWRPRWWLIVPASAWTVWYLYGIVTSIFKAGDASRGLMPVVVALGFAAVICGLVTWPHSVPARVLAFAPIAYIGRISYGLYLWHYPVTSVVARSGHKDSAMALLIVTAVSVPLASVSYFVVERPFLRLKERFRSEPIPEAHARPAVRG